MTLQKYLNNFKTHMCYFFEARVRFASIVSLHEKACDFSYGNGLISRVLFIFRFMSTNIRWMIRRYEIDTRMNMFTCDYDDNDLLFCCFCYNSLFYNLYLFYQFFFFCIVTVTIFFFCLYLQYYLLWCYKYLDKTEFVS